MESNTLGINTIANNFRARTSSLSIIYIYIYDQPRLLLSGDPLAIIILLFGGVCDFHLLYSLGGNHMANTTTTTWRCVANAGIEERMNSAHKIMLILYQSSPSKNNSTLDANLRPRMKTSFLLLLLLMLLLLLLLLMSRGNLGSMGDEYNYISITMMSLP